MGQQFDKNSVVGTAIKVYLFPTLVTILASLIWRDVSEMRNDVKSLLAQSNIDKTKIEALEKKTESLEKAVFKKETVSVLGNSFYDQYFKHEDFFDVKKYVPKETIL